MTDTQDKLPDELPIAVYLGDSRTRDMQLAADNKIYQKALAQLAEAKAQIKDLNAAYDGCCFNRDFIMGQLATVQKERDTARKWQGHWEEANQNIANEHFDFVLKKKAEIDALKEQNEELTRTSYLPMIPEGEWCVPKDDCGL